MIHCFPAEWLHPRVIGPMSRPLLNLSSSHISSGEGKCAVCSAGSILAFTGFLDQVHLIAYVASPYLLLSMYAVLCPGAGCTGEAPVSSQSCSTQQQHNCSTNDNKVKWMIAPGCLVFMCMCYFWIYFSKGICVEEAAGTLLCGKWTPGRNSAFCWARLLLSQLNHGSRGMP